MTQHPKPTDLDILSVLLPHHPEEQRLAFYKAETVSDTSSSPTLQDMSKQAAKGQTLPLLVHAGKSITPNHTSDHDRAKTIAEHALSLLEEETFQQNLQGVFLRSKRVYAGPARWFYATAVKKTAYNKLVANPDAFWQSKSSTLLFVFLSLAERLPLEDLSPDLYHHACALDPDTLSPWEKDAWNLLDNNIPASILSPLLTYIEVAVHWKFTSAHAQFQSLK